MTDHIEPEAWESIVWLCRRYRTLQGLAAQQAFARRYKLVNAYQREQARIAETLRALSGV